MEKSMTKITLNQFALTIVIIFILTLGSAAATSDSLQDSVGWFNKGLALDNLNKSDEAINAYEKAIEINPQDSDAWTGKGLALDNLNKYDEAIKAFDKAIEINPQDSYAWDGKGIALGGLGKYDEVIKAFDKAIEINPQDSLAWHSLAPRRMGVFRHRDLCHRYTSERHQRY